MEYGLIGKKLGHSFSKIIHEHFENYAYDLVELSEDDFSEFITAKEYKGLNITIPYKEKVIPYLDFVDAFAKEIGAVNTVINKNGMLCGYNTDFGGLKKLIEINGFDLYNKKVLILGTGGTSKTACAVCKHLGAGEIVTVSRNGSINYSNVYTLHCDADIVINTTPCGMYPDNDSCAVDVSKFSFLQGVIDVVYNPLQTKLVRTAKIRGIKAVGGLYMLTSQAILAAEYFTGKAYPDAVYSSVYSYVHSLKQNIVLSGMPGCGKSTIGKELAIRLGKAFIDTDTLIVENEGMEITEIFGKYGEDYFRKAETEAVKYASSQSGTVIATGGGAVLKKENIDYLKSNGSIFFLNRPISDIVPTEDRPLSSDYEALKKRFEERYTTYINTADYEIHINGSVDDAVNCITEILK